MTRLSLLLLTLLLLSLSTPTAAQNTPLLRITEIMPNPAGDDATDEWIELTYTGNTPLPINNHKIGDEETAGGQEGVYRFPTNTVIQPGETIVIARTAVGFTAVYGHPPDYEIDDTDPAVPDMRPFPLLAVGDLALADDGDELILFDDRNRILDAVNYGESTTYFAPSVPVPLPGQTLARVPVGCDTDTAADWRILDEPTPDELPEDKDQPCARPTAPDTQPIGAVQGDGDEAPAVNQSVRVSGVVIGRHADRNSSGTVFHTLYIQDAGDGRAETSDGLPLFTALNENADLQMGDRVLAEGQVTEFFGLTELDDNGLRLRELDEAGSLPAPIQLAPPHTAEQYEQWEGMRAALPVGRVVGPTFETAGGCGFAVTVPDAAVPIRHTAETDISAVLPILAADDRACDQLPALKRGDTITGLIGPLTYNFDQYKLIPQNVDAAGVQPAPFPPLPEPPTLTAEQISIATFNVENHFDTVDDTGDDAEPKPSAAYVALRRDKIAATIEHVLGCPTLLAVQEVENAALLRELAQALARGCGFAYEVAHLESYDGRGIDNALLVDGRRAAIENVQFNQTCSRIITDVRGYDCPAREDPLFSRPPLQVDLLIDGRQPLTVWVNHFKSKRGGERETAPRRLVQAQHLADVVRQTAAQQPGGWVIALGDFNDYADSAPMQRMTNAGLENVLRRLPPEEQYSFNFGGVPQLIDGILVDAVTAQAVTAVQIFHVNADYPDAFTADPDLIYKSADHDPSLAILQLPPAEPDPAPTADPDPTMTAGAATATPSPPPHTGWGWIATSTAVVLLLLAGGWWVWRRTR